MPLTRLQAKRLQEMGSFDANQNNVSIKIGMHPNDENNVPYDDSIQPPPSPHETNTLDQEVDDFLQDPGAMDVLHKVLKLDPNRFMDHLIRLGATPTNTSTTTQHITLTILGNTPNTNTSISLPSNDPNSIAIISQLLSQQNINTSNTATISMSQDNQNPNS